MKQRRSLDRPCWLCDWVFTGEQAAMLRAVGHGSVECPLCGSRIGLRGQPYKRRKGNEVRAE